MSEHRFTPAFVAWMRLQPQIMGRKQCSKLGVGGMIRELREMVPANGCGEFVTGARADLQLLESHCRLCGKCSRVIAEAAE